MLARFQSSRTADHDTLVAAFETAGFRGQVERSRLRKAYSADGVHAGRPVRIEAKWAAGRQTDVPVLHVTLQAPLAGGRFDCRQHIVKESPLPVPGADTLVTDGSPRAGLQLALAGKLGQDLAAFAAASQNLGNLRAHDDQVVLEASGWPPTARELLAAVELCATLADALAAIAPGHEAEGIAWAQERDQRLQRSRRVALGMLAIVCAPVIGVMALMWPQ